MKTRAYPLVALALASFGYLNAENSSEIAGYCSNSCNTGMSTAPRGLAPSARPMLCDNKGLIVDAEFLFWKSNSDLLTPAIKTEHPGTPLIGSASNYTDSKFEYVRPRWDVGFRAAIGYNIVHDSWDVIGKWTCFYNHAKTKVEARAQSNPVETLTAFWAAANVNTGGFAGPTVTVMTSNWKLELMMIDLELGRKLYVGQWLSIRPNIGLRGARVNQHYAIDYYPNFIIEPLRMKNNFGGIGVKAGFNSQWNIGCGFSLYGDSAVSIVYGAFSIFQHEMHGPQATTDPTNTVLGIKDTFHDSRMITDLALGLRWEHQYPDTLNNIIVSLGWEEHVFFDQMQIKRFTTLNNADITKGGTLCFQNGRNNLATQGLTAALRFEY